MEKLRKEHQKQVDGRKHSNQTQRSHLVLVYTHSRDWIPWNTPRTNKFKGRTARVAKKKPQLTEISCKALKRSHLFWGRLRPKAHGLEGKSPGDGFSFYTVFLADVDGPQHPWYWANQAMVSPPKWRYGCDCVFSHIPFCFSYAFPWNWYLDSPSAGFYAMILASLFAYHTIFWHVHHGLYHCWSTVCQRHFFLM